MSLHDRWVAVRVHVPMGLTYFRLASVFYLPAAFLSGMYELGVILAIVAALSDLEGYLARAWNCTSDLGAIYDIRADKWCTWTMMGCGWPFVGLSLKFVVPMAIILVYDMTITHLRNIGRAKHVPRFAGKLKVCLLFPGAIAMLWTSTSWIAADTAETIALWLLGGASFFAIWSLASHLGLIRDCPDPRPTVARAFRAFVSN